MKNTFGKILKEFDIKLDRMIHINVDTCILDAMSSIIVDYVANHTNLLLGSFNGDMFSGTSDNFIWEMFLPKTHDTIVKLLNPDYRKTTGMMEISFVTGPGSIMIGSMLKEQNRPIIMISTDDGINDADLYIKYMNLNGSDHISVVKHNYDSGQTNTSPLKIFKIEYEDINGVGVLSTLLHHGLFNTANVNSALIICNDINVYSIICRDIIPSFKDHNYTDSDILLLNSNTLYYNNNNCKCKPENEKNWKDFSQNAIDAVTSNRGGAIILTIPIENLFKIREELCKMHQYRKHRILAVVIGKIEDLAPSLYAAFDFEYCVKLNDDVIQVSESNKECCKDWEIKLK